MGGVEGGGVGGRGAVGAVGAVGAQEGAGWYKMFRLCEGHTHFCSRTLKEAEVWREGRGVRGGGQQIQQVGVAGTGGGLHTHLSLSGDVRKRRGRFPSAPEPAEHEPHRWRQKTMKTKR